MPAYRIYRMKDSPRRQFRSAPHTSGTATLKRKDYEEAGSIEADTEYAAWYQMRGSEHPLEVGDVLETDSGELRVCKYIGFEPAQWLAPNPQSEDAPDTSSITV